MDKVENLEVEESDVEESEVVNVVKGLDSVIVFVVVGKVFESFRFKINYFIELN